ncbi:MAG: hypothetical protein WBW33_05265 [Bryobacteraceae bacterium]
MPLPRLQSHVLGVVAAQRSPDSYIPGGVALNRQELRYSGDTGIFQASEQRLETAAEADAKALTEAGFPVSWKKIQSGKRDAEVEGLGDRMRQSPEELLSDITRHSRFTAEKFRVLAT